MQKNVGGIDKILRLVIGVALIGWGVMNQNWLGAIGILPLMSGLMSTCGLYSILGISTSCGSCCSNKNSSAAH